MAHAKHTTSKARLIKKAVAAMPSPHGCYIIHTACVALITKNSKAAILTTINLKTSILKCYYLVERVTKPFSNHF